MKKKALLKEIIDDREDICNLYTRSNDAKQEIANIKRTLKNHGEAHMAQDILPQFTKLCEKVEGNHQRINSMDCERRRHVTDISLLVKKVENLEKHTDTIDRAVLMAHSKQIADLEEANAALWESIDTLKTHVKGLETQIAEMQMGAMEHTIISKPTPHKGKCTCKTDNVVKR